MRFEKLFIAHTIPFSIQLCYIHLRSKYFGIQSIVNFFKDKISSKYQNMGEIFTKNSYSPVYAQYRKNCSKCLNKYFILHWMSSIDYIKKYERQKQVGKNCHTVNAFDR